MMKKSLLFAAILMVSVFVSLNSCKKDEAPDVDCSTISGATYNAKVKPIIDAYCVGCHSAGGEAENDGKFTTFAEVSAHTDHIYDESVLEKTMPPSGALPDSLINILHCWKEAGFPQN